MQKVIIVIPTYNEEKNIFKLTKNLFKTLPNSLIYIVDDTKNSSIGKIIPNNSIIFIIIL